MNSVEIRICESHNILVALVIASRERTLQSIRSRETGLYRRLRPSCPSLLRFPYRMCPVAHLGESVSSRIVETRRTCSIMMELHACSPHYCTLVTFSPFSGRRGLQRTQCTGKSLPFASTGFLSAGLFSTSQLSVSLARLGVSCRSRHQMPTDCQVRSCIIRKQR